MQAPQVLADPERSFLDSLPAIDRIVGAIARRHSLAAPDAEEFAAWARARLIESEYAVFRKFSGRSSLTTYLTVVLTNAFRDYRNSLWGRWRPSAAALRLGPTAIRIEELLYRDGRSLREAIGVLQSSGCHDPDAELTRLAARIPQRQSATEVGLDDATDVAVAAGAANWDSEDQPIVAALRHAVEQLPPEERVITRMRFWDDISVADIARALGIEQKPLYRKLESIKAVLRACLEARGIDRERASEMLSGEAMW